MESPVLLIDEIDRADEAFEAAEVDDIFQAEFWGDDDEARERRENIQKELGDIERYITSIYE